MQGRGEAAAGEQAGGRGRQVANRREWGWKNLQTALWHKTHKTLITFYVASLHTPKPKPGEKSAMSWPAWLEGSREGDCDGTTPVSTAVALVALAALGQIPGPCCESFWVCRRVASGLFMYFPLSLLLTLFPLSLALLMCLQSNYAAWN